MSSLVPAVLALPLGLTAGCLSADDASATATQDPAWSDDPAAAIARASGDSPEEDLRDEVPEPRPQLQPGAQAANASGGVETNERDVVPEPPTRSLLGAQPAAGTNADGDDGDGDLRSPPPKPRPQLHLE